MAFEDLGSEATREINQWSKEDATAHDKANLLYDCLSRQVHLLLARERKPNLNTIAFNILCLVLPTLSCVLLKHAKYMGCHNSFTTRI